MSKSRTLCFLGLLTGITFLVAGSKAFGETVMQPKEIDVGERAPLFALKDQNGREFSLAAMTKKSPVAVVFIRSIGWCSYCQLQTVQLSENLARLQAAG